MREVRSSGAKELERTRIEDFHERNNLQAVLERAEQPEYKFPRQRFLLKLIIFRDLP